MKQQLILEVEKACITCDMRTTAFHIQKLKDKRQLSAAVFIGVFLGFYFAKQIGLQAPVWFIVGTLAISGFVHLFFLLRSLVAKGKMQFLGTNREKMQFKINENQIVWIFKIPNKAYAEIPLFDGGFIVEKKEIDNRIIYTCKGRATKVVKWAADRVREGNMLDKILNVRNIRLDMMPELESYPEIHNLLEELSQKGA